MAWKKVLPMEERARFVLEVEKAEMSVAELCRRYGVSRKTYYSGPLTEAMYPNHVWAVDYKGWFRTGDGKRCEPLTISDLYSRYVVEVRALPDQSYEQARGVFERVFEEYGLPEIIRSDNGGPFASRGAGGLSRLSVWWVLLGL